MKHLLVAAKIKEEVYEKALNKTKYIEFRNGPKSHFERR